LEHGRIDALARALAGGLPRRRLLGRLAGGLAAATGAGAAPAAAAAQESGAEPGKVELAFTPCACAGDRCLRCLIGLTGGGVVGTAVGQAQLVLFASRLEVDSDEPAAGFVRWVTTGDDGDALSMESIGTIAYGPAEGDEQAREIRGTMRVNGAGDYPFVLRATDLGPDAVGQDSAALRVGNAIAEGSDFGYEGEGPLVGGDLQLLDTVAPIAAS